MTWYYAVGSQQQGPVTEDQLQGLIKDGVVAGDTLVWREGMANWLPYRAVAPPGSVPPPVASGDPVAPAPTSTGQSVGATFNQRKSEAEFFQTDYTVSIGQAWSRAWKTFSSKAGLMIGGGLLLLLVGMVGGLIPLVSLIIAGPLGGGFYWLYLRCVRGEEASVGDGFAGFGPQFLQLMLGHIVPALLTMLPLAPGLLVLVVGWVASAAVRRGDLQAIGGGILIVGGLLCMAGLVFCIYFGVAWSMTLLLVMDKRLDFWRAMGYSRKRVGQHFFRVLIFFVATSLVSVLGVLALGVGLLVSVPVALAMIVCLYEDLFREFDPVPHG
ncbi:MAG: hypothetical protein B9S33_04700 [Pedosphaera sp. Tous-C6FEB]|nr:MAG: hypothetical protein B9S33_04700 [Pedosphaera sp. Tous-C6FEB]